MLPQSQTDWQRQTQAELGGVVTAAGHLLDHLEHVLLLLLLRILVPFLLSNSSPGHLVQPTAHIEVLQGAQTQQAGAGQQVLAGNSTSQYLGLGLLASPSPISSSWI